MLLTALFCLDEQNSQIRIDVYALCIHFLAYIQFSVSIVYVFSALFAFCKKTAQRQYCEIEKE